MAAKKKITTPTAKTVYVGVPESELTTAAALLNAEILRQTQAEIQYYYGTDVTKWAIVQPFGPTNAGAGSFGQVGSITSLYDQNLSSFVEFWNGNGYNATLNLIFDFGRIITIRGMLLTGAIKNVAGAAHAQLTTYFTTDNVNWTQIDTKDNPNGGTTVWTDQIAALEQVRAIKVSMHVDTAGGQYGYFDLYELLLVV